MYPFKSELDLPLKGLDVNVEQKSDTDVFKCSYSTNGVRWKLCKWPCVMMYVSVCVFVI